MQNEFEKQVQQKMEEFNLIPSEPVWEKIEQQIQKKKDKRRFLIWIPLLLLLLAGGVWWINNGHNVNEKTQTLFNEEKLPVPNNRKGEIIGKRMTVNQRDKIDGNSVAGTQRTGIISDNKTPGHALPFNKVVRPVGALKNNKHIKKQKQRDNAWAVRQNRLNDKPDLSPAVRKNRNVHERIEAAGMKQPIFRLDPLHIASSIPIVLEKEQNERNKNKWKLGVTAGTGYVWSGNGIHLMGQFVPPGVNYNSSGPFVTYQKVGNEKFNRSFWLGVTIQKALSDRLIFSTGLEYRFYQSSSKVGADVHKDTVIRSVVGDYIKVSQYYDNRVSNAWNDHNNSYHYLSLPLSIDYFFLKNVPVTFHTGFALQYLMYTNALEDNGELAYKNKSAFRRMQLLSEVGFNYTIHNRYGTEFKIGPVLQYGLSGTRKTNSESHINTVGIRAGYYFK